MIQVQSWLTTIDNSGADLIECIKTLGGFNRRVSYASDRIITSIKTLRFIRKVRKGEIHPAIIARTKKPIRYLDGTSSFFKTNAAILISPKGRALGTRFFGHISRSLRQKRFRRLLILCGWRLL